RRCGENLPVGAIHAVREDDGEAQEIVLEYTGGAASMKITRAKLAAALILYCKLVKVPLPAGAEMTISVARGLIVLTVRMSDAARRQALQSTADRGAPRPV
ncbi:MAG TPA: hypothetical protein VK456_16625, partial [Xanthobacteraceae bacterium]|nr:hypothetical protein [Xanthobacteraceae bacterium]